MKKYTKLMGILLALVMLIALVPMTALADTPTYPPNTDAPGTMTLVIIKRVYGLSYTINIQHLLSLVKLLNPRHIHRKVRL